MYNALQSLQAFEMGKGAREERERADAMKGIGNALAGGDWTKAASGAFGMGDISTGLQLQQYGKGLQDAEAESRRVNMIRYGMGLLQSPPEQREAMRGQIAQTLGSMGLQIDPQQAAQMDLSDNGIKSTLMALQDTDGLMKMYQAQMSPAKYGLDLKEVIGPDGKRMLVQASEGGGVRALDGYAPMPETPKDEWVDIATPPGQVGVWQQNTLTGAKKRVAAPPSGGISIDKDGNITIGGPAQGLGYGSAPKGKDAAIVFDENDNAVVTPSPQQAAYQKAIRAQTDWEQNNDIVMDDIDRALSLIEGGMAAGPAAAMKDIPIFGGVTPAGQLENLISTIRANIGFDKLDEMRQNSPTGGALGNVTEKEIAFLQAVKGSLEQDQSAENLAYNLRRIRQFYTDLREERRAALSNAYPDLATTVARRAGANQQINDLNSASDEDLMAILKGD